MIIFKLLRYKNFLSVGKSFNEIDFLKGKKKVFVGANASGKSTCIDALSFVLYNRSFRKTVKDLLVNTTTKKNLEVEVEFSIGEKEFKIRRGVAPVFCELYIDGVLKDMESNARDYQSFIENTILRMTEKTFRQIVVLGSSDYTPFLKCPAYIKREIVEDLLEISIFSNMNNVAKQKMSAALTEFNTTNTSVSLLTNDIVNKTDILDNLDTNTESTTASSENEKDIIRSEIAVIEKKLLKLNKDSAKKSSELLATSTAIAAKKAEIKKIDAIISKIENNEDRADKTIEFLTTNDSCEFCHQDIEKSFKETSIAEQHKKKHEYCAALSDLNTLNTAADTEIDRLDDISTSLTSHLSNITVEENKIVALNDKIDTLNKAEESHSSVNIKYRETIEEDLSKLNIKHDLLEVQLLTIKKEENSLTYLSSIFKDDGIKSKIIRTYLPVINRLVRKYLDILDFGIDFRFDEYFEETISTDAAEKFSYYNFSTGQMLRVDLAILFMWRELSKLKNSAATNLIILDEIHSSTLDEAGTDAFNTIIDNCVTDDQTVVIITHSPETVNGIPATFHTHQLVNGFTSVDIK